MNINIHYPANSNIVALQEVDRQSKVDQVVVVSYTAKLKQLQQITVIQISLSLVLTLSNYELNIQYRYQQLYKLIQTQAFLFI